MQYKKSPWALKTDGFILASSLLSGWLWVRCNPISPFHRWATGLRWGCRENFEKRQCLCGVSCMACCRSRHETDRCQLLLQTQDMRLKPAGEDSSGTPWHALPCSPFSQMCALGLLAWSPRVCCWCLQQAQGCLETSQHKVPMTQLTWTLGMPREGWVQSVALWEEMGLSLVNTPPFLRSETALTSLFCSHYLLWYRGKGVVRAEGVFSLPSSSLRAGLHQGTVLSTSQNLLSTYWKHYYAKSPRSLHIHERGKEQHSKSGTLELSLDSIVYKLWFGTSYLTSMGFSF